jgi:hypothetical protein
MFVYSRVLDPIDSVAILVVVKQQIEPSRDAMPRRRPPHARRGEDVWASPYPTRAVVVAQARLTPTPSRHMVKAGQSAPSLRDHDLPRRRSGLRPTDRDLPLYRLGIRLDMSHQQCCRLSPPCVPPPPCPTTIACVLTGPHCC